MLNPKHASVFAYLDYQPHFLQSATKRFYSMRVNTAMRSCYFELLAHAFHRFHTRLQLRRLRVNQMYVITCARPL